MNIRISNALHRITILLIEKLSPSKFSFLTDSIKFQKKKRILYIFPTYTHLPSQLNKNQNNNNNNP